MPLLARLLDLYSLVVLVAVVLSWVPLDQRNPLVTITHALTEPILAPIRNVLPPIPDAASVRRPPVASTAPFAIDRPSPAPGVLESASR